MIEAKKEQRRKDLAEGEEQKIEQSRKALQSRTKLNKQNFEVETIKPIYKRTGGLIDSRSEKIKVATQRVELNRKLTEVEAEFKAQIEEERIRGGPEAAERYQKTIAANETELQHVLTQWATDELRKEQEQKEVAIRERITQLSEEQEALIKQEHGNGG